MTRRELGDQLGQMYRNAAHGETVVMIHLFGIQYADEIQTCAATYKEIALAARIPESYGTEISKGVNLGKYVRVK